MTFPCVVSILCEDYETRVRVAVPDEGEARIIIAMIQLLGLPRVPR